MREQETRMSTVKTPVAALVIIALLIFTRPNIITNMAKEQLN